jgi:hypothetical protein
MDVCGATCVVTYTLVEFDSASLVPKWPLLMTGASSIIATNTSLLCDCDNVG